MNNQAELDRLLDEPLNAEEEAFVAGYEPVDDVDAVREAIRKQNEAQANRQKH